MWKRGRPPCLLPEIGEIEALAQQAGLLAKLHTFGEVTAGGTTHPLYALVMGSESPDAPVLALFGGVHGVERIGTEVVLAYMHSLIEGMAWLPSLKAQLNDVRLVFMPLVNPGGMCSNNRCNPNGVDLMRNAPVEAEGKVLRLLGGHRISPVLPWYRGVEGAPMEPEAQALCEVVERYVLNSPFSISLDCHSGYGGVDRIWFPYAGSTRPFENAAEVRALSKLFYRIYPNHRIYTVEPQSLQYTTHGDLWDYLYKKSQQRSNSIFIPLTLEMGSWAWLKKNPRYLFRFPAFFNPMLPHRHRRILRRHLILIEFLLRAVHSYRYWLPKGEERQAMAEEAEKRWYGK